MMKKFATILLFALTTNLKAFTLQHPTFAHFPVDEVLIDIADTDCANINETVYSLSDKVKKAVELYWNSVPSSRLKLKMGEIKTGLSINSATTLDQAMELAQTNRILLSCSSNSTIFNFSSIHATANIRISNPNKAAILINNVGTPVFKSLSDEVKIAIIAHEIGHAIGIGHSEVEHSLMFYSSSGKQQLRLARDDQDAITYLYPHRPPMSCGTLLTNNDHNNNSPTQYSLSLLIGFLLLALYKMKSRFT